MRKHWILFPLLAVAAWGPRDACEALLQPKLLSVKDLTLVYKADAMGVPPLRVPEEAVGDRPLTAMSSVTMMPSRLAIAWTVRPTRHAP